MDIYARFFLFNIICYILGLDMFHSKTRNANYFLKEKISVVYAIIINMFYTFSNVNEIDVLSSSISFLMILTLILDCIMLAAIYLYSQNNSDKIHLVLNWIYELDNKYQFITKQVRKWIVLLVVNIMLLFTLYIICLIKSFTSNNKSFSFLRIIIHKLLEDFIHYIIITKFSFLLHELSDRLQHHSNFFRELLLPTIYVDDYSLETMTNYVGKMECIYKVIRDSQASSIFIILVSILSKILAPNFYLAKMFKEGNTGILRILTNVYLVLPTPLMFLRIVTVFEAASDSKDKVTLNLYYVEVIIGFSLITLS